jgi:hypothetical protein
MDGEDEEMPWACNEAEVREEGLRFWWCRGHVVRNTQPACQHEFCLSRECCLVRLFYWQRLYGILWCFEHAVNDCNLTVTLNMIVLTMLLCHQVAALSGNDLPP